MAATIIQKKTFNNASASSHAVTFDNPTTAGSCIAVLYHAFETDETGDLVPSTPTGNNSETYSVLSAASGTSIGGAWVGRIFTAPNIGGRSGHEVTMGFDEASICAGVLVEISDADTSTPQAGGNFASNVSSQPSGAAATPSADGLHLALIGDLTETLHTFTPGSGWTEESDFNGSDKSLTLLSRTAASGVSQTPSATASGTPDFWQIVHGVIKNGAGGGSPPVRGGNLLLGVGS